MALSKDEVVEDVKNLLLELRKKHDIKEAYLFGSYAGGNPREHSDVDIAVILGSFKDGGPFDERFEIFHEIQEYNSLYEVVCFGEAEFSGKDEMLIRHIKRAGIRII